MCANRFIVQEGIHDVFVAKLTAAAEGIVMGHGMEAGVAQGPLINAAGRSKVARHVANALEMGAKLETGGGEVPSQGANFFTPTVLSGVTNEMAPFREETFGPVCPVAKFKTEEEAIALANDAEVMI